MPRIKFPDPYKGPLDSYATACWRHVRAKTATIDGPSTATIPSMTATSAPESHSKLDQAFKDLEIDHGVHCDPQFSTIISTEDAPAIVSMLRSETKEGSTTLDLLIGVESIFFRRSDRSTIKRKPYDAWKINPPKHEQFRYHASHTVDHELNTASISFSLAADATWNNNFQRGVPGLLGSAKVFDVDLRCSHFLTVTVGAAELSSLHERWIQQAEQELSKQLSVRRANAEEDRCGLLTRTRYYGYLISGLSLEIHEMVYRPGLSRPRIPVQLKQSKGQSGGSGTKGSASNTVPKPTNPMKPSRDPNPKATPGIPSSKSLTNRPNSTTASRTPSSNVPTSGPRTSSRTTSLAGARSKTTSRGTAASESKKHQEAAIQEKVDDPLTFTTSMIKTLSLACTQDIVQFSAFHRAVMKWAQVSCCTGFVENLHQLCWQPSTEKSGLWQMTDEEMHVYWDSSVAPQ